MMFLEIAEITPSLAEQFRQHRKLLEIRRFDCVFSLKLTILCQISVISSIFKQALIYDQDTDK